MIDPTLLKKLFPNISNSCLEENLRPKNLPINEDRVNTEVQNAKPKRHKAQSLDKAVPGKIQSVGRVVVCFTLFRVRPLDPDNAAASGKDCLDGLRHSGLILGDEPWKIDYKVSQEKVSKYSEEKTVITLEYPDNYFPAEPGEWAHR